MTEVNLSLRRNAIIRTLPWGTRIGFSIQILKEVAMPLRGPSVLHVGRNTWVGILPTQVIDLGVVTGVIR